MKRSGFVRSGDVLSTTSHWSKQHITCICHCDHQSEAPLKWLMLFRTFGPDRRMVDEQTRKEKPSGCINSLPGRQNHSPSTHQRFAAHIVSQGYLIAASLVGHHNDLHARYRFSKLAWRCGTLAKDRTLQVAALRQLAVTFDYLERPQNVLQTYLRALPHLNDVPPRLRACLYAALSGVSAQFKQKQEAARFIGLAPAGAHRPYHIRSP